MPSRKQTPALKSAAEAPVRKKEVVSPAQGSMEEVKAIEAVVVPVSEVEETDPAEAGMALGLIAAQNPFRFFNNENMGLIFGLGKDVITLIRKLAPHLIVADKLNPQMVMEWLKVHAGDLGKINPAK